MIRQSAVNTQKCIPFYRDGEETLGWKIPVDICTQSFLTVLYLSGQNPWSVLCKFPMSSDVSEPAKFLVLSYFLSCA